MTNRKTEVPRAAKAVEPPLSVISPELAASIARVEEAMKQSALIRDAIERNSRQRREALNQVSDLSESTPGLDAELILATAKAAVDPELMPEVTRIKKAADTAATTLEGKQAEAARCESAAKILLAEALKAEENVDRAKSEFTVLLAGDVKANLLPAIAAEIRAAAAPLAEVMRKVRAISNALPGGFLRDYTEALQVVDPELAQIDYATRPYGLYGANLLSSEGVCSSDTETLLSALKPIAEIGARLKAYQKYNPIQHPSEQAPYQIKGSPVTGRTAPQTQEPYTPRKTLEEALKEPYVVKGDAGGVRTWKEAQRRAAEMDIGRAMMAAADSADS